MTSTTQYLLNEEERKKRDRESLKFGGGLPELNRALQSIPGVARNVMNKWSDVGQDFLKQQVPQYAETIKRNKLAESLSKVKPCIMKPDGTIIDAASVPDTFTSQAAQEADKKAFNEISIEQVANRSGPQATNQSVDPIATESKSEPSALPKDTSKSNVFTLNPETGKMRGVMTRNQADAFDAKYDRTTAPNANPGMSLSWDKPPVTDIPQNTGKGNQFTANLGEIPAWQTEGLDAISPEGMEIGKGLLQESNLGDMWKDLGDKGGESLSGAAGGANVAGKVMAIGKFIEAMKGKEKPAVATQQGPGEVENLAAMWQATFPRWYS